MLFATAAQWVTRLADAHTAGRLQDELTRLGRYPLLVVDEVGYIPFEPDAAALFLHLVSSRCKRASLIVTSTQQRGGEPSGRHLTTGWTARSVGEAASAPGLRRHRPTCR